MLGFSRILTQVGISQIYYFAYRDKEARNKVSAMKIFTCVTLTRADRDLEAWHQFGLQSFYGPWGVVNRKPNGDLVSYADYGSPIPSDFQAISTSENDVSSKVKPDPYPLEIFADPSIALDLPSIDSQRNVSDEAAERSIESPSRDQLWGRSQRDTLELIGIVGVIENVENISSSEESASEKSERSNISDSSINPNG